ncbi:MULTISPECIES: tRNA pseudouridine(38-40) synthase TruA [unclassified Fusibacter]|uniref:tRNA pseudouridine(38-40) synthase TruA n=1 Tax=unclassified Fusibacter TaxID=2624464 RepID=UPI001010BB72|nr:MULTISPECIES: tRNA pseudouridine(38-40) synthase TruA [unclassified Fusibacter]MCK8059104.1 tRNA pseudouridine(38-40) synthase TruA [Fusibacter sp. A2]NPE22513.1 tRNA pseudouridine(38-40) synthase TruA [Fusibacter sp. A1]RXV60616.1 tRNA pseudouridine(38-40) synthase TruA [Fusibacter sp. A1]
MQNIKMVVAYDGRKYIGFAKKKNNPEKSIQYKIESILQKLYEEEIEVISSINTDAGVHAKGQVVNFNVTTNHMSEPELFEYFEKYLPDDIIVLSLSIVDDRFHSRYNVESLTYEYRLWKCDAPYRPLFERKYVNVQEQKLNVSKMKIAAEKFVGQHDFMAFTANKKAKNSVKEIFALDVSETKNEVVISITADGFLVNMERIIVGTLVQIGIGQLPVNTVDRAFETSATKFVGHKAMADALTLVRVNY